MNLKSIKLSGFKSFVDPTTIPLPGRLTAIVGPNGCGKSNIVDAIRWVIGESSAKQLRGEHLSDVIFNGAANRKPVGQAAVELTFDNTQGRLGAEYAQYNEISIRRELSRDGQSQFYLNGTCCRRRDITDLFLGTGLGPHSYAIIEQGVISKLVEGKPEDIRVYLEEAAGTSKYRERRRETENRLRHTRENLDRLTDVRVEMEKQLEHLKRQANAAERYKVLKQEQRLVKAQCHALQCKTLDQQLAEHQHSIERHTTQLEANTADHRRIELAMEQQREQQVQANEAFNNVQARYYQVGASVARQEQQIAHIRTQAQQLAGDLAQMEAAWQDAEQQLADDQAQVTSLTASVELLEPQTQQATQVAQQLATEWQAAEHTRSASQTEWERFQTLMSQAERQVDVEQTRIHHLTQKIHSISERVAHLEQQRTTLSTTELPQQIDALSQQSAQFKHQLDTLQNVLTELNQQIQRQKQTNQHTQSECDRQRQSLHQLQNQKASLEALQQAALGKHNQGAVQWLEQQGWKNRPRLLEGVIVEKGWETAVETVLAPYLEAICTDDVADFSRVSEQFSQGKLAMFCASQSALPPPSSPLASRLSQQGVAKISAVITTQLPLEDLLHGIYVVEDAAQALPLLSLLAAHESLITRNGLWFGRSWLRVSKLQDETSGVIQRKQALQEMEAAISAQQHQVQLQTDALQQGQALLTTLERERDAKQQEFHASSAKHNELHAQLSAKQAHLEQRQQQAAAVLQDYEKLQQQRADAEAELQAARVASSQAQAQKQELDSQREDLVANKNSVEANCQQLRQRLDAARQAADECQVRLSSTQNQLHYLQQNILRSEKQLAQLQQRRENIQAREAEIQAPLPELHTELERLLQERVTVEQALTLEKQQLSELEYQWREYEKQRAQAEKEAQTIRDALEKIRITHTTASTHRENHLAHIIEIDYQLDTLLQEMPTEANEASWQQELERLDTRIQRLGAINLAAIEEYKEISERKTYLDSQDKDLRDAMETLEEAIRKIDRESRARLRETFDKANIQFKELFSRMFEGGNAELEWMGDEVLSAGVVIRAQPAGKRNSLLHLLSGGEKALTAIALVFALFQLNPAPFCVLDEVDAPLDDANVGRFCRLVKSMAPSVQFLFISHNKTTMEMAQQMVGVTMQEPGVSRMVSVDMAQALEMAEVAA